MRRPLLASIAVILLAGCNTNAPTDRDAPGAPGGPKGRVEQPTGVVESPKDPAEKLHQQIRSAAVQLNPAVDKIQEAYEAAKTLEESPHASKELKTALEDAVASITEAGGNLSNFTEEPPAIDAFKKELPKYQKLREAIITGCNDAIHELSDALATLDDVSSKADPKLQNPLEGVVGSIDEALGTVRDALTGVGGKEEKLDDIPDSPAPAPGTK